MKCFFHSSDLDGHCSGAVVKHRYPECEMIGVNYGQPFPWEDIASHEPVFMVDFCLQPFQDMNRLNNLCLLHWVDHHTTSIDKAIEYQFAAGGGQLLSIGKAACELTWEYIYPQTKIPTAVYLLGRYDVWDHADERVLPFQYGMRLYADTFPDNQALWRVLFDSEDRHFAQVMANGSLILQYERNQNAKFCSAYAFETWIHDPAKGDIRAICANRVFSNSKLFDSVYHSGRHDIMVSFGRRGGKWVVSLYTTHKNVDCGAIALAYGGGGHKQAAGFTCSELPFRY